MVEAPEILMEIREETMISPKGGKSICKTSHFIKPVLKITDKTPELPSILLPLSPVLPECRFNGWGEPDDEWVKWVDELHCRYKIIWKKAGIFEAVLSTRYRVVRDEELVLALAERWCCESNTFVFPWGETSVTLEDLLVLGGFSVLGGSVTGCVTDRQVDEVEKQLVDVYEMMQRASLRRVEQTVWWMKRFRGRKSEVEHAAFLCLWLSRFVLPCYPVNSIVPRYFRLAVCLAKGREIAIAPFILANIYKDLSLLKSSMENGDKGDDFSDDLLMVTLWAPLQWVQVWAWERFPEFQPKPNNVKLGEPRLARWANVVKPDIGNVRPLLTSTGDSFVWRPYCVAVENVPFPGLYCEKERWVFMGEDVGKEVKTMAHCLRVTELVGLESIEQYNPHRVAMQFGYDQDFPCVVNRSLVNSGLPQKELEQLAWLSYVNPVKNELLYVPSRSYEPQVTVRYMKWLRGGVLTRRAASDGIVTGKRNTLRLRRLQQPKLLFDDNETDSPPRIKSRNINDLHRGFEMNGSRNCFDVSPGVSMKFNGSGSKKADVSPALSSIKNVDVPPGFVPKSISTAVDVPPGFTPNSTTARTRKSPSLDFTSKETIKFNGSGSKKADVSPALSSTKNVDVPPGFVPKNISTAVDVPPGFTPNSTTARKRKILSQDFTSKETIGHSVDMPSDFLPKSIGSCLAVPPGFKPPMKLDALRNKVSAVETLVKVKKERVESSGQALLQFDHQTVQNLHGEIESTGNNVSDLDILERIRQLEKKFAEFRKTTKG